MPPSATLVLLPTYEEADNIATVLRRVREVVPEAGVLVVDDSSPDGTADLARSVASELGQIDVVSRPAKAGLGSAYRAGAAWGLEHGFDVFVLMDADLSHDPAALPSLLAAAAGQQADVVLGSRYVADGAVVSWPLRRLLLSRLGNAYVRLALRLPVRDATTGYRVWRGAAVKEVLVHTRAEGYGFVIESNYRAVRSGHRLVEVPIVFTDRRQGRSKMSGRIIVEALALVTRMGLTEWWGRAGTGRRRPPPARPSV